MQVNFTPEQEARLQQLASRTGRNPEQVIEGALDRILDYQECFLAAVEEGRDAARRGELLEHDEVVDRIEKILHS